VPHQQFIAIFLLLQGILRTGVDTMRLLTSAAYQSVTGQLGTRDNPIIAGMIKITASGLALAAFTFGTDVQINEQS